MVTDENLTMKVKETSTMGLVSKAKMKYGISGLMFGAIIIMIVGFAWGGWTTARTTERMTGEAVLASQAAICVAQFTLDPNYEENLKEFEKVNTYERYTFIEKGGWDKMPGQERASWAVSQACADGVELFLKKSS
jgi:hypothetical protein